MLWPPASSGQHGELFLSTILEGPNKWKVRPVAEFRAGLAQDRHLAELTKEVAEDNCSLGKHHSISQKIITANSLRSWGDSVPTGRR